MARIRNFNVLLNDQEYEDLDALAREANTSKGSLLRSLLLNRRKMTLEGQPFCSNGRACFVAHLHPDSTANQATPGAQVRP